MQAERAIPEYMSKLWVSFGSCWLGAGSHAVGGDTGGGGLRGSPKELPEIENQHKFDIAIHSSLALLHIAASSSYFQLQIVCAVCLRTHQLARCIAGRLASEAATGAQLCEARQSQSARDCFFDALQ